MLCLPCSLVRVVAPTKLRYKRPKSLSLSLSSDATLRLVSSAQHGPLRLEASFVVVPEFSFFSSPFQQMHLIIPSSTRLDISFFFFLIELFVHIPMIPSAQPLLIPIYVSSGIHFFSPLLLVRQPVIMRLLRY